MDNRTFIYNTEKFLVIHNLIFVHILNNWNRIIFQVLLSLYQGDEYLISSSLGGAKNYRYHQYFVPLEIDKVSFHSGTIAFLSH
jgi:hypothetical protein